MFARPFSHWGPGWRGEKNLKRTLFVLAALATVIPMAAAQSLYNNGTFGRTNVTGLEGLHTPGSTLTGNPAGTRISEVGADGVIAGYGAQGDSTNNNRMADDFVVTGPAWNVTSVNLFMYQTGNTGTIGAAGSITGANVSIVNDSGGPVGSTALTGTFQSAVFTDLHRAFNGDADGWRRQVQNVTVSFSGNLAPGTYWLVFQATGTGTTGPWAPYVANSNPANGYADGSMNAMQSLTGGAWTFVEDGITAPRRQDLPFYINGSPVPEPATMTALALGAVALLRRRRKA